ncbi:hypothetical protein ALC57_05179 [Trachymyrmex cornetzi]|uniref:Uncharacterized protein n=1 Tax=Trachymyrmex cornetzi TaxID=471704 RepID=A0A151JBC7_9HYME|nr:hypothetical protein ALC57_05179 [Trachymyrmex cornetzi]
MGSPLSPIIADIVMQDLEAVALERCPVQPLFRRNRLHNNNDPRLLAVLAMVHKNPHISTRQVERELGIPQTTVSSGIWVNVVKEINLYNTGVDQVRSLGNGESTWSLEFKNQLKEIILNRISFYY